MSNITPITDEERAGFFKWVHEIAAQPSADPIVLDGQLRHVVAVCIQYEARLKSEAVQAAIYQREKGILR